VISTCLECGKSFESRLSRPQRFCSPPPGVNMSVCAKAYNRKLRWSVPEKRAAHAALQRRHRARRVNDPAWVERNREYQRAYRLNNPERTAEWRRKYQEARRAVDRPRPLSGSVLAASSPRAEGRDLLVELLRLVPATLGVQTREEVVAEAALMVLEGTSVEDAARAALRQVRRSEAPHYNARQIEYCDWL
jgi:hypothetical protein